MNNEGSFSAPDFINPEVMGLFQAGSFLYLDLSLL
jgi:hypothetical protein